MIYRDAEVTYTHTLKENVPLKNGTNLSQKYVLQHNPEKIS